MPTLVDVLRRVPLLASLDDAQLTALAKRGQERVFTAGTPVTSVGSRGEGFFVIVEGQATVRVRGAVDRHLRRGDYFGELALIAGRRRSADITADTDLRCFGLSRTEFRAFVAAYPDVAWTLLERMAGLVHESEERAPSAAPARRKGLRRKKV
jgi:CRP-like cAMP-binding protein